MKNTFLLSFLLISCIFAFAQDKTISKSFSNIKNIRLSTGSGDINLKKATGSDVKLTLKYSYADDEFTPVIEESSGRLILKEEFSRGSHSGRSSWSLEVPDNLRISINTGSGDLTIDNISTDIKSNSGSGNVMLTGVSGVLDFNTGSGDLELEAVGGDVSINVGSGTIRATNGTGNYSFNAGSGNIRVGQLKGDFSMNVGSGSIQAKGLSFTGSSSFNSGSGDATVTLAGPLDHNISVNSGSGNATLNFSGNAISGEVVMTANKKGGNIVAPFNFDKEEVIDDNHSQERIQKTAKLGAKNIVIKVGTGSGTAEIAK